MERSEEPFPRLFYPGTVQREKAVSIDIGVGEKLQGINIIVPAMLENVTVEGLVLFKRSTGKKHDGAFLAGRVQQRQWCRSG